jgi:triphosphoribosyl-dephospho-CoA synthase
MSRAAQRPAHIEQAIRLACLLEAAARKPGNVHPGASFADTRYEDFVRSAEACALILARTGDMGVGPAVLATVRTTQQAVGANTNLGIVLLLAPLAATRADRTIREDIARVLDETSIDDARDVYEAIRLAAPGGLGGAREQDVAEAPTMTLKEVMALAQERDSVARQYATDFETVLDVALPCLARATDFDSRWERHVVHLHLTLMRDVPDTLIARRCGGEVALAAAQRAGVVLQAGGPDTDVGRRRLAELDKWLRTGDNRRNPGTTADLVTAALFAALREGVIVPPSTQEITQHASTIREQS